MSQPQQPSQGSAKTLYSGHTLGEDYQKIHEFDTDHFHIIISLKNNQYYYYSVSKKDQTSIFIIAHQITKNIYQAVKENTLYLVGKNQNEFDFSIWQNGQRIIFEEGIVQETLKEQDWLLGENTNEKYQPLLYFETQGYKICICEKDGHKYYYSVSKVDQTSYFLPVQEVTAEIYQAIKEDTVYLVGYYHNGCDFSIWDNGKQVLFEKAITEIKTFTNTNINTSNHPNISNNISEPVVSNNPTNPTNPTIEEALFSDDFNEDILTETTPVVTTPSNISAFNCSNLGREYQQVIYFETSQAYINICSHNNQYYYYEIAQNNLGQPLAILAEKITESTYKAVHHNTIYLVSKNSNGYYLSVRENNLETRFETEKDRNISPEIFASCAKYGIDAKEKIAFETENFWINICIQNNEHYYYSVRKDNPQDNLFLLAEKISEHSYKATKGNIDYIISDNSKGFYLSVWQDEVQTLYEEELPKETIPEPGEYSCQALGSDYQNVISFETPNYYVNICRQGNREYHYSVPKHSPENSVVIPIQNVNSNMYEATLEDRLYIVFKSETGGEFYIWQDNRQILFEKEQ
jgi:hypothetical protein